MASFPKPNICSFVANADLSAHQYCFVKLVTDSAPGGAQSVDVQSTKAGKVIGILMNAPVLGQFAEVAMIGGGAKLKLDGTVHVQDKLIANTTTGNGIANDASNQWVGAQSLQEGVVGDVIPVMVTAFESAS